MKTTVEVSDDLYRRAKSEAALRGRKLKDLVEEGLRLVLERPNATPSLAGLMNDARGMVDSGSADLASNPEHLTGLSREPLHTRPVALGRVRIASIDNIAEALAILEGESFK